MTNNPAPIASCMDFVRDATRQVEDPETGRSIYEAWRGHVTRAEQEASGIARQAPKSEASGQSPLGDLGAGSDFCPFFDYAGIPSIDISFGGDYGERLSAALADAYATAALPMLLIRADALEISADILEDAARSLISAEADTAFGPASDGGFWLLGLRQPDRSLVAGLPAPGEGPGAGRLLLQRLASAGLRVALAPRVETAGAALRF